ncbi:MAG TPA: EF-hand domain-containing protein [Burkholderiales bacterium]|nr:EF-hand domain-containing protein [Burkholderiales bacterium]
MRTLAALLALALAGAAYAQSKPATPRAGANDSAAAGATAPRSAFTRDTVASNSLFERLDKNRDGYLTGEELTSPEAIGASWIAIDRDNDGRISREEFTALQDAGGSVAVTRRP